MKSVKIVFVALVQDEWNLVKYLDYVSFNDENSTSQQYQTKTVLEMHRHNCSLQDRRYFSRFSGEVGEERVHGSRHASFCSPEKKREKITPVLQANLIANLQSEKNALQPGKKTTCLIWH